jgi:hypothetical protein
MEESVQDDNKICAQYLQELRGRYGEGNPILIRPDKRDPRFTKLDQDMCAFLQAHGWAEMNSHMPKWLMDENGTVRKPEVDLTSLRLLDPALKFLEGCKVTVEQHTDTKITIEPDPEQARPKRLDMRGRAAPFVAARMQELEVEIENCFCDMGDPKADNALAARMRLRLIFMVRGADIEREKTELYQEMVKRLKVVRPVRVCPGKA